MTTKVSVEIPLSGKRSEPAGFVESVIKCQSPGRSLLAEAWQILSCLHHSLNHLVKTYQMTAIGKQRKITVRQGPGCGQHIWARSWQILAE